MFAAIMLKGKDGNFLSPIKWKKKQKKIKDRNFYVHNYFPEHI